MNPRVVLTHAIKKYSLIQISMQPIKTGSKGLHHLQISFFV